MAKDPSINPDEGMLHAIGDLIESLDTAVTIFDLNCESDLGEGIASKDIREFREAVTADTNRLIERIAVHTAARNRVTQ